MLLGGKGRFGLPTLALAATMILASAAWAAHEMRDWVMEFPLTDFDHHSIDLDEIVTDGPRRDTITPIHQPRFVDVASDGEVGPWEPVLSVEIDGDARAYPLRILLYHEIVNDTVGGVPVLVSYCPLCNSGVVFDRRLDGATLDFGNPGRIRHFDMVMYDHQTESWWQQFLGEAIVGALTGRTLRPVPARLESLERFRARAPQGRLLVPNDRRARDYGVTPYVGVDSRGYRTALPYPLPAGLAPLARVVVVGDEAWTLDLLRQHGTVEHGDLVLTWRPGQNSIHDAPVIARGRDVGNVVVQRRLADGRLTDMPYDVAFAFAFAAFRPDGRFHLELAGTEGPAVR